MALEGLEGLDVRNDMPKEYRSLFELMQPTCNPVTQSHPPIPLGLNNTNEPGRALSVGFWTDLVENHMFNCLRLATPMVGGCGRTPKRK